MIPVFSKFWLTKTMSRLLLLAFWMLDFKVSTHENEDLTESVNGVGASIFWN